MKDVVPTRKSGRQRVPNKKYTNDAFEGLSILSSDSEEELAIIEQLQNAEDDEDFPAEQSLVELDEEEDSLSLADDASDGSGIKTPIEVYEDAHSYASTDGEEALSPKIARRKGWRHRTYRDPNIRTRGMPENPFTTDGKQSRLKLFTGEGTEDIVHVVKSRDQWALDPTLPCRSRLCQLFSHTEEKRQMEATVGWDWYYDAGGRDLFAKQQTFHLLNVEVAANYVPEPTAKSHSYLMGPYGRQLLFTLGPSQTLGLDAAWSNPCATDDANLSHKCKRHGWMLNVGARVKCLDWAPNHEGDIQYLAIAVAQPKNISGEEPPKEPPSFTPSTTTLSAIEIWAFPSTNCLGAENSRDSRRLPELRTSFVSDWGDARQLKWCPVPRASKNEDAPRQSSTSIGLLAGIWGDGFARVLDVHIDQNEPFCIRKYESAAFAGRLDDTLSTCLTWLSATDLAVGHANGELAIYDIYPQPGLTQQPPLSPAYSTNASNPPDTNASFPPPTPWLRLPLHATYILSLTSAYPSHPTLLISSSLSGHVRLTDLRAPTTDFVLAPRTRTAPSSLAYHDALLSVIGAEESTETIRVWGLRCFYASIACGKLSAAPGPGTGVVDVGKFHATVVMGGADGSVVVTNPMRRILGTRETGYQQCIFKHEWVRRPPKAGGEAVGKRYGLSRITECYKGEKLDIDLQRKKEVGSWKKGISTTTIHEEETACTTVAWNPNLKCGGWLAVGWGSGLVRVQDVAI